MKTISLNRNQIKYIVIVAMVLDHLAAIYFPLNTLYGQAFHFFGRLTGPIMAYFVVEGYIHTRSVKKYVLRMGIFALVSWIPFSFFENGSWPFPLQFGVIYTLFLGLLSLVLWDTKKVPYAAKSILFTALIIFSIKGDWAVFDVAIPFFIYIFRNNNKEKWVWYYSLCAAATLYQWLSVEHIAEGVFTLGTMLCPLIMQFVYNGESGKKTWFNKWFFYIFYPLHLIVLAVLKFYI